jgi:hypothetical protein
MAGARQLGRWRSQDEFFTVCFSWLLLLLLLLLTRQLYLTRSSSQRGYSADSTPSPLLPFFVFSSIVFCPAINFNRVVSILLYFFFIFFLFFSGNN